MVTQSKNDKMIYLFLSDRSTVAQLVECWTKDGGMLKFKLLKNKFIFSYPQQLYEMIHVQHGIMLVGEPMSCKTKLYEVLSDTLTHLSEQKGAKHQV